MVLKLGMGMAWLHWSVLCFDKLRMLFKMNSKYEGGRETILQRKKEI